MLPSTVLSPDNAILATATGNTKKQIKGHPLKTLSDQGSDNNSNTTSRCLSQLLNEKQYLTLSELEDLRKAIESQQQIQMAIKNSNPKRVQIQCRHFKSKKCTFQITFKAISSTDSSRYRAMHHEIPVSSFPSPNQSTTTTTKNLTTASTTTTTTTTTNTTSTIATTASSNSSSSTIFSGISYDSSVASAQLLKNSEAAASQSDIKRTSSTGRREESFTSARADSHVSSRINAVVSPAGFPAATVILHAAVTLDASCSPSVGSAEYCIPPTKEQQQNSQSLHCQAQLGPNLSMSSWQQSNPPATMLLQNFDASATMWEGEKREERSDNITIITNNIINTNSITRSSQAEQAERIILEADCESSFSSEDDDELFLLMIDEGQLEGNHSTNLRSLTVSPFVINDASSSHQEVLPLFLNNNSPTKNSNSLAVESTRNSFPVDTTQPSASYTANPPVLSNEDQSHPAKNEILLFRMSTCKLMHRNHPVMSDEKYTIHLAKRWLEGHQEKIERIYEDLRERKGTSLKITPKVIKKQLQDTFDIDIYARCTSKEHKKFLKKKLDNLMKTIRLKERANAKSSSQHKREASISQESTERQEKLSQVRNSRTYPIKSLKSNPSRNENRLTKKSNSLESAKGKPAIVSKPQNERNKNERVSAIEIEAEAEESTTPVTDVTGVHFSQTCFIQKPFAPPLPETTTSSVQSKSVNEEWESFIQLDLPQKRMQPTYC